MKSWILFALPLVHAIRIIQSNDDGWAELQVRTLFYNLANAGHEVILSSPAEQQSGKGSLDAPPKQVNWDGCAHTSCPAHSAPIGSNSSDPRLNWVNSFPVTAIKNGIQHRASELWGEGNSPELAVTGPNVGSNIGVQVPFSGTVGAAVFAAQKARIPALAFSGFSGEPTPWYKPVPIHIQTYADLALNVTTRIVESGTPYLPRGVFLNVNFPEVTESKCNTLNQFKFILTRINWGVFSKPDVNWCGSERLPTETEVILQSGCYASISVGDAEDKTTADRKKQEQVLAKLKPILSCLP